MPQKNFKNSAKYGTVGPLKKVGVRRCGRFGKVSGPPLRMAKQSRVRSETRPTPDVESSSKEERTSEGWSFRGAAVAEGLEHLESRRCGRLRVPRSRFGGRQNGQGADSAEDRIVREPIRRRREWERSRRCSWKIDLGADSAAVRLVPGADFNCF